MMEINLWSKSLKERIEAEKYFTPLELKEIKLSRLRHFGFGSELDVPDGNHLRLNSFWLFIGVGNSASEKWDQLPRMDITLGEPHLFERINENDSKVSRANYHKQLRKVLSVADACGYIQKGLSNGLSYQYVGNLNISDIVARNQEEIVKGRSQKGDLNNNEKILKIINLIKICMPAFVVNSPGVFNQIRKHYRLELILKQDWYVNTKSNIYFKG
jgi:hypothetical protein